MEVDLPEVLPGFVYEFQLEDLVSAAGGLLANPTAFYTVNRLTDGTRFTGPFTARLFPAEAARPDAQIDTVAGKDVYSKFCVGCHQPDGRGGAAAADFVGDKTRLAKSDTELIRSIRRGVEGQKLVMPPFGDVLSESEIRNVIGYIRTTFDPIRARGR